MKICELMVATGGTLPPLDIEDERRGGGPNGGAMWFNGSATIRVPKDYDYAQMVFVRPEDFGVTTDQVLAALAGDKFSHDAYRQWLQQDHRPGSYEARSPLNHFGGRQAGIGFLLSHGWAYIEYEPPSQIKITVSPEHAKTLCSAAGKRFSLMALDRVVLWLCRQYGTPNGNQKVEFRKEDYPGFTGVFGGLMDYLKTGQTPEADWIYVVSPESPDTVARRGLAAEPGTVSHGNAYYTDRYRLEFYVNGMVDTRPKTHQGHMYRIPRRMVPDGLDHVAHDYKPCYILYGRRPFALGPAGLQVKTAAGWKPVA